MPDFCMCSGGECPRKENCYRFTAKPDTYVQSYFVAPPFRLVVVDGDFKQAECQYFWETKK